jgi:RNA polymerase sigma-70 factor (ECF subfamily)
MTPSSTEEQFLAAFEKYSSDLFRHASFKLSNRDRATDLTQDTFIKAWEYARKGGEVKEWKSFLYHAMDNLIIDEYRKKKSLSLDALIEDDPVQATIATSSSSRSDIEDKLNDELMIEKIRGVIPQLSPQYQTVLTLRYIDDFSIPEIAKHLKITENVVSVRIHRALAHMRELCEPLTAS